MRSLPIAFYPSECPWLIISRIGLSLRIIILILEIWEITLIERGSDSSLEARLTSSRSSRVCSSSMLSMLLSFAVKVFSLWRDLMPLMDVMKLWETSREMREGRLHCLKSERSHKRLLLRLRYSRLEEDTHEHIIWLKDRFSFLRYPSWEIWGTWLERQLPIKSSSTRFLNSEMPAICSELNYRLTNLKEMRVWGRATSSRDRIILIGELRLCGKFRTIDRLKLFLCKVLLGESPPLALRFLVNRGGIVCV